VAERAVANASPLILLARGACFDFLRLAGTEVLVPAAVAAEIRRRGAADPTVRAMDQAGWMHVVEVPPIPGVIQSWDLGPGESAVLALAHREPGLVAILDDLAARRCAAALGIPVRGTLGLVLLAKHRAIIPEARPVLERIRREGMYLSGRLLKEVLALVGE
jgi:predicted nucleic acid-binding protein